MSRLFKVALDPLWCNTVQLIWRTPTGACFQWAQCCSTAVIQVTCWSVAASSPALRSETGPLIFLAAYAMTVHMGCLSECTRSVYCRFWKCHFFFHWQFASLHISQKTEATPATHPHADDFLTALSWSISVMKVTFSKETTNSEPVATKNGTTYRQSLVLLNKVDELL